jgi:hypothetical protein
MFKLFFIEEYISTIYFLYTKIIDLIYNVTWVNHLVILLILILLEKIHLKPY